MSTHRITLEVDGIGRFVFRTRTMADTIRICAERATLLGDAAQVPDWLDAFAIAFATLKVLTEEAPYDWDLDAMDPLNLKSYERVADVYRAFRAHEHAAKSLQGQLTPDKDSGQPSASQMH